MANIQTQLQKAIEMRQKVNEFAAILTHHMSDLENDLEYAVRAGFPVDIAATYSGRYLTPDSSIINELCNDMRTRHVDFLDRVIANLIEAKDRE